MTIQALESMQDQLGANFGDELKDGDRLQPVVARYLLSVVAPTSGAKNIQVHYMRELRAVALAVDNLLGGRSDSCGDILLQRMKSICLQVRGHTDRVGSNYSRMTCLGQVRRWRIPPLLLKSLTRRPDQMAKTARGSAVPSLSRRPSKHATPLAVPELGGKDVERQLKRTGEGLVGQAKQEVPRREGESRQEWKQKAYARRKG